ncbi:MAG: hypothetical protein WD801_08250 [Gemmatimonadaceae bacterium]
MTSWLIAAGLGAAAAVFQYGRLRAPSGAGRLALAVLRAVAVALLVALLLDAPMGRARATMPWVFVDLSQSMTRGSTSLTGAAWDSAQSVGADSVWVFGDTVHPGDRETAATGAATRLRDVVERTMVAGQPVVLITDGEVQDSSALDGLPGGSRVVVLARPEERDVAIVSLEAPRAAVDGDSLAVRITLAAGSAGAAAGSVTLHLGTQQIGRWPLDAMSAWGERQLDARARAVGPQGGGGEPNLLRAVVTTDGDAERRNDTLTATVELSRAASAVFVSTSPDQDARFALAVLRGALALPTRGFLRVAPGMWRHEGSLAASTEAEVRDALRAAPVAILHGDTAIFGPPRSATLGPLALMVPSQADGGEWYASGTPPSPLSVALSGIPLDSLPPVSAGAPGAGDWVALEARLGREPARRPLVVGSDAPRRVVTVSGSGFWRWRFRGGASADAYAALWGGIFDWLAAERADRRAAMPEENVMRAGRPIRWRRGTSADSVVQVVVMPRDPGARADTIQLRFPTGAAVQESPPLPRGTYDVFVPGGRTLLVVNASAELLPARPGLRAGDVGRRARAGVVRGARGVGWLYGLAILLLCAEWVARRRAGLR